MKVIIFKSRNHKVIIGFSNNPVEFAQKWLKERSQYTNITIPSENKVEFDHPDAGETLVRIYGSELRDGETCWISCNDNLAGFNDNH